MEVHLPPELETKLTQRATQQGRPPADVVQEGVAHHFAEEGRFIAAVERTSVDDLVEPFKSNAKAFIKALQNAGATVSVSTTKRSDKRAYLFHWCWKIGLGKAKASEATKMIGVGIERDHGDAEKSKKGAKEMIDGFWSCRAAPGSEPSRSGRRMVRNSRWGFMSNPNQNASLHTVGESYGVKKLKTDASSLVVRWPLTGHVVRASRAC